MRYCAELPCDSCPASSETEKNLFTVLYQAVQDVPWREINGPRVSPARVLGTLLVFCYFRELYSSGEIALTIRLEPDLQYITTRSVPDPNELRAFRRANRSMIEHGLATLFRLAEGRDKGVSKNPLLEAKRRVDLAVRCDSFELDI